MIRIATNDDMPQVLNLWQTCFDDTMKFVLWYFARYWKAEHTLGVFEQHENEELLQASAQVIPYNLQIRNTALSCGYIVGVDTAPEARKVMPNNCFENVFVCSVKNNRSLVY